MTPRPLTPAATDGAVLELGRYMAAGERRVLWGQWFGRSVRVTDAPASGTGEVYVVESRVHDGHGALRALLSDYLTQARAIDGIPATSSALGRELQRKGHPGRPVRAVAR
jgi:hypothetical protein